MSERSITYKGKTYGTLREIDDPDFAFYNTKPIRTALHVDASIATPIVAREMDGLTYLAWNQTTLMPARKTFDMAVAVACILDTMDRHVTVGDIGTGTGVFPITVANLLSEKKDISYHATDISSAALQVASINAQINGLNPEDINWKNTDGLDGIHHDIAGFDVVFSNPPFTRTKDLPRVNRSGFNPDLALDGGADGAQFYRQFTREAVPLLNKEGVLVFQLPLEEAGIEQVVRSVCPIVPGLPIHLLADHGKRYTQFFPLFMTIGGSNNHIEQFKAQKYRVERI
ncbi:MAG: methyltransferase [Candidatus Roizmanbacteria bacterium]|nr:methyltransferase [Candidatus Roizmanbacteria bacterium]